MNAKSIKRLMKEFADLQQEAPPNAKVTIVNDDLTIWYVLIHGLAAEYERGEYILQITHHKNYPFSPPDYVMLTPSGRFEIGKKLCFSNSGFHPEDWSPMWSMRTIILGFVSFFLEKSSKGIGHIESDDATKRRFAAESITYNNTKLAHVRF